MSGGHAPVLLEETVALVTGQRLEAGRPVGPTTEGVYVDATFGRGGHTRRLLELLGSTSRVIALDRDPEAVAEGWALATRDHRMEMCHENFVELDRVLDRLGIDRVQGVMMDLGVSSPQLDDPLRGFSFRHDAPLDMRMDTTRGPTAADWLNEAEQSEIARVLHEFGEERHARRIAAAIVAARPITTTGQLAAVVSAAQPRSTPGKHDATRVFQAVRIQVNGELQDLQRGLEVAFERLTGGGRMAVISFHSLEDRLVKHFFRDLSRPPQLPRRLPVRDAHEAVRGRLVGRAVTAGEAELARNPRARSARLRALEKAA